jgi:phospholipase D1/2
MLFQHFMKSIYNAIFCRLLFIYYNYTWHLFAQCRLNFLKCTVDDEYVIVGSANLNQRSLAGDRDTEIAHGSYQPSHLNGPNGHARGQVHIYRMSLWYEHFMSHYKDLSQVFLEPESLECVRTVRVVAQNLWEMFTGDTIIDLPGHLLPFPIKVSDSGELSDLPENGLFPDTTAKVKGNKSLVLPPLITT